MIHNWINNQETNILRDLFKWSSINTHVQNIEGQQELQNCIREKFKKLHCSIEDVYLHPYVSINEKGEEISCAVAPALVISKRPAARHQILLSGHLDTVFPKDSSFQKATLLDNGWIQGPGVADMKGGLLTALYALEAFEQTNPSLGWTFVITPDEEIGSPSSSKLLCQLSKSVQQALVFEPGLPNGSFVIQRGGSQNIVVIFRGIAAHAGRDFHSGRSALLAASSFVSAMDTSLHSHEAIINVGALHSGHAGNIVPDLAICTINIRGINEEAIENAYSSIQQLAQEAAQRDSISYSLHTMSKRLPMLLKSHELLNMLSSCTNTLGLSLQTQNSQGVSDANIFSSQQVPTLDTLGPIGKNLHTEQEMVLVKSLVTRIQLTYLLLLELEKS